MTDSLTIASLALKIFMKNHYSVEAIPLIKDNKVYREIKKAYYGGKTEVYKPYGEKLHYLDVNGLYPFVALQDMPGTVCTKKIFINKDVKIENLFGFFYCDIETNKGYLGLLPVRDNSGLKFPLGKWRGWYFSEELKYAKSNGYKIKVIKGYEFNREKDVFKSYVEKLHELKSNADNRGDRHIFKLLLNSLLGRFGLNLVKYVTKLVDKKTFLKIKSTRLLVGLHRHIQDSVLVSYIPEINKKLCDSLGIDLSKARKYFLESDENIDNIIDIKKIQSGVSVAISAAVTAYGRIHMSKIKKKILELGGIIYYSDTDSIVYSGIELSKDMLDSKELGKLKMEYFVERGYFISGKTYCLVTKGMNESFSASASENAIIKAKGMKSYNLSEKDFIKMLQGETIDTAIKITAIKDYEDGSVTIKKGWKCKIK